MSTLSVNGQNEGEVASLNKYDPPYKDIPPFTLSTLINSINLYARTRARTNVKYKCAISSPGSICLPGKGCAMIGFDRKLHRLMMKG